MDKLTTIKIKYEDETYSDEIPVSVLAENVEWDSTHTLVDILGSIDVGTTGSIQNQISQLFNEKVSATQLQNYVASQLNDINVNPVGSAVVVDSSLTISGAAADAKVVGDALAAIRLEMGAPRNNPVEWALNTSISTVGDVEKNKPTFALCDFIEVSANDTIKYDGPVTDDNGVHYLCNIAVYNETKTFISRNALLSADGTITEFTIASNGYIRVMFGRPSATGIQITYDDIEKCQFENLNLQTPYLQNEIESMDGNTQKYFVPDCDYISVPAEVVGADHWQALVKVGNEIWLSQNSSTVGGTVNGIMDRISASDFSYIGKFNHNLGHLNAMSYDEDNDWLITGYASDNTGDAKDIYIYKNVLSWTELASGSNLDYSNVDKCVIHMGTYLSSLTGDTALGNALWTNKTSDGHRFVIVMTGITNKKLVKISLGYGTTQRRYGTYTASSAGEPNGTFDVIWVKELTMPTITGVTGVRTMVNQDFKYYKGGILCAISAVPVTALFIYEINGSDNLGCDIIRSPWVNDSNVPQTGYNQGVLVMDDYIYIGIAPQTAGSSTPNKFARFKI